MNTHLEILVKELIKNGVSAKCCEIITDNEGNASASEPFLDFSEHDKTVAKEKDKRIAELEKQIGGYRERNILLRQRCTAEARDLFDCEMFGSFIITIPRKSNDNAIIEKLEEDLNRLTMDLKNRMGQIHELKEKNAELDHMRKSWIETATKRWEETIELERKIEDLEAIIADGKKSDISVSENGVSVGCECGGYHLAKERMSELEKENNSMKERFSLLRTRCKPGIEKDFDKGLFGKLAIVGCNEEFTDIQNKRISELEDRHQYDCIEINRLNVALDVMTEKYMKLREVHGL